MVLHFCSPSAYLQPSWLQVAIFIDFDLVFDPLGCLPGLSWEGLGAILASSRAYLGLSCGSFLRSSGCLGSPAFLSKICPRSVQDLCQDLSKMPATNACHKMPGSNMKNASPNCRARNDGRRLLPQRGFQWNKNSKNYPYEVPQHSVRSAALKESCEVEILGEICRKLEFVR